MYYDDQARRFNFVSGLIFGAMLGTGLALMLLPERALRRRTRRISGWKSQAAAGIGRFREEVLEPVLEAVASARLHDPIP